MCIIFENDKSVGLRFSFDWLKNKQDVYVLTKSLITETS